MKRSGGGGALYFNRRHHRVGHLYQGRFGAQLVEGDEHLLKLSRYIHLNPVQVRAWRNRTLEMRLKHLRDYRWSSYPGYAGLQKRQDPVAYAPIMAMLPGSGATAKHYRRFVETGLAETDEEFVSLLQENRWVLGSDRYRDQVESRLQDQASGRRPEDAGLRSVRRWEDAETVLADVCRVLGVEASDLSRKRRDGTQRAVAAYALVRRAGLTQRQVADRLGMQTGAAVSLLIRSLKRRIENDAMTRRVTERLSSRQLLS